MDSDEEAFDGSTQSQVDEEDQESDNLELLIESIRRRNYLYDQGQKDYKNAGKKELAWIAIGSEVKQEVTWCKNKWKYLRDTYVKKRKDIKGKSGDAAKKIRAWPYFGTLKFLDGFTANKTTSGNLGINTPAPENFSAGMEQESTTEDDPPLTSQASFSKNTPPSSKRPKLADPVDTALMTYLSKPKESKDVHHHFCMSLAEQMRAMPEASAAYARLKVQEVLFQIQYQHVVVDPAPEGEGKE